MRDHAAALPDVAVARDYLYMCSEPGQELIKQDIQVHQLDRVVVASCSPLMHETTFRLACGESGMNPYLFQMANIREHCSWVTEDAEAATTKAKRLVHGAVRRVALQTPLETKQVEVKPAVLIVGGGIAGIEAGETDKERRFTLEQVRCVGCCGLAPVVIVDEDVIGHVKASQARRILRRYRDEAPAEEGVNEGS